MGLTEPFKRWRRSTDYHSINIIERCFRWYGRSKALPRKIVFFLLLICFILYYYWPGIYTFYSDSSVSTDEILQKCLDDHVRKLYFRSEILSNFIFYSHHSWSNFRSSSANKYPPMIGNGAFGIFFHPEPALYLKEGRTLSLSTDWNPLQTFETDEPYRELYYTNVLEGTVFRYQCLKNGLTISSKYFAHRTEPNLLYQDIVVSNPTEYELFVNFGKTSSPHWSSSSKSNVSPQDNFISFGGLLKNISNQEGIAISVTLKSNPSTIHVSPHKSKHYIFPVVVVSENVNKEEFLSSKSSGNLEKKCLEQMKNINAKGYIKLEEEHITSWNKLRNTGLNISLSKAAGALNSEQINATEYYVLSSVPMSPTYSKIKGTHESFNRTNYLSLVEGCYGGYHHTLQAISLWQNFVSLSSINDTVNLWLLTLEKQGCSKLISSGAEGVAQAMTLSYGGFRFNPHHLEMKIEPKFLHRDYHFRNILLDFKTHLNVSVILQENNKAVLTVSINKIDKDYWACDGGCVEDPVKLSSSESNFPVKITEPSTSILYVTSDRSHIELIKDTLHVHNIVEAPAHDHHVVALHKHGSHLGGLPIMFWVTVITLIVIFHLFLCKLIYNEFRGKQDKGKSKYSRIPMSRGV